MMKKLNLTVLLLTIVFLAVACGGQQMDDNDGTAVASAPTDSIFPTDEPVEPTATVIPTEQPTEIVVLTETPEPTVRPTEPAVPTETPEPTPTAALSRPEQLLASFTSPSETNRDLLVLYGQVVDVNGGAVPNAAVEIWQTDENGVYDHPGDRTTASRDTTFQFYGSTTTDEAGWYAFRTIIPGEYEPRPRHIHYKVKQNGATMLTSQFYFSEDIAAVQGEGMFQDVENDGDLLLVQLVQSGDDVVANGRIVIDTGIGGGELTLTPSQAEGPFYPVVVVAEYDNDLTTLP